MIATAIHNRYLRDPLPIRLGGLAANLARVATCAEDLRDRTALMSLLEESEYFAEWSAPDASIEVQTVLAELQRTLALWRYRGLHGRFDSVISQEAQHWSGKLLALSGLTTA